MDTSPFPPPSYARKRRCAERTIDLNSFFSREEDRPKMPRFLLMSCAEEGKTFKTVSAVRLARATEEDYGKLQAVVRQRNGTILLEARTDEQIGKFKIQSRLRPPGSSQGSSHLEPVQRRSKSRGLCYRNGGRSSKLF